MDLPWEEWYGISGEPGLESVSLRLGFFLPLEINGNISKCQPGSLGLGHRCEPQNLSSPTSRFLEGTWPLGQGRLI